jgi:hydroxymethylglutaryl-CoA lyase
MSNEIKIIECPRDAWQGLKGQIPTAIKVQYLRALIGAGFKHIDAVSFVSPRAIPQMADSEAVIKELDPPDDVEIIGIVVNQKGAERAIATEAVQTLGFPYSVSPTFLERNQHQTLEAAADELEQIKLKADAAGLNVVAYISMAFGNPYGDLWNAEEVIEAVGILADMNITQISLAWRLARTCTARKPERQRRSLPHMRPAAGALIRRSEVWGDVLLRRMK